MGFQHFLLWLALGSTLAPRCEAQTSTAYKRDKCSRSCPCYYNSLFCKGHNLDSLPADLSPSVQNIDFQENLLTEITNDTLKNLPNLQKLLLGSNQIYSLSEDALVSQKLLNSLDLSRNRITELAPELFNPIRKKLEHLSLQGNNISRVEGHFRDMRILRTLNVRGNNIQYLTTETFYHNRRLRLLQLADNSISHLPVDTFRRQSELVYLFLDRNPLENVTQLKLTSRFLESISMIACKLKVIPIGFPKSVKELNLAGNQIESVSSGDLSHLKLLHKLDLSGNRIAAVDSRALRHLVSLQVLYLSRNALLEVPKRLPDSLVHLMLDHNLISSLDRDLSKAIHLKELALNHNMIEFIHKKAFQNLTDLKNLALSHNVITRLPAAVFQDLVGLKSLDLSDNPLHTLEAGCLDGLWGLDSLTISNTPPDVKIVTGLIPDSPSLRILNVYNSQGVAAALLRWDAPMYHLQTVQYLNLMRCSLQRLRQITPQYLPNLYSIQLSGNPWFCNRDLYWIQQWLTNGFVEEPHINSLYCETPPRLRGRRVIDLTPHDWASADYHSEDEDEQ